MNFHDVHNFERLAIAYDRRISLAKSNGSTLRVPRKRTQTVHAIHKEQPWGKIYRLPASTMPVVRDTADAFLAFYIENVPE